MNTHSIQSSFAPFQFLARKFNQFNRNIGAENRHINPSEYKTKQPTLTGNPQKIVENQLVQGIQKVVAIDKVPSPPFGDTGFSPDQVANRVLEFVNQAYGQQQNDDPNFDRAGFFSQIKQGLETGFSAARDTLDQAGLLQGQQQKMDATYAKIQVGLSKLESDNQAASQSPTASQSTSVLQAQGYAAQIKQSEEIEVVTKEGDVIKIRLAQSVSSSQSAVNIEQDGNSAYAFQSSAENSSELSISIDGNLNEDEQKSLTKLLKQIDTVGHEFFIGKTQAAFNHAQKIGLDTEQIASFSLSLSLEKSVQAVAVYQQAAFPDQQIEADKIKQAAHFFTQARESLKTAQSALAPFEDPLSVFNALFNAVDQVNQVGTEPSSEPTSTWQQIIKPLGEIIFTPEDPAQA